MVDLNWDEDALPTAGVHYAEVKESKVKKSESGNTMFSIVLYRVDDGAKLCYDNILLTGAGRGIGMQKLKGLGVPEGTTSLDAADLIGRRCFVAVKSDTYNGKTRLAVDIAQGPFKGLWLESAPPEGFSATPASADPLSW